MNNNFRFFAVLLVFAVIFMVVGNAASPVQAASLESDSETYIINPEESTIGWLGEKVVGQAHNGTIDILEGSFNVEDGTLVSGSIVIDMTSIENENLSGRDADRLVDHLESDDFFSVDTYPTSTVELLTAEALGDGKYAISGELTIKDIAHPIEFEAQVTEEGGKMAVTAEVVFDRTLYDVTYKSASIFSTLGDKAIKDEVKITVELVALAADS